jgi:hypothetical protein
MAGIRGRSGPPGNQNAFRHSLVGIAQRRADAVLNPQEQSFREENPVRLIGRQRRSDADQHRAARADDIRPRDFHRRLAGKSGALCETSQTGVALIGATKAISSNIFVQIPIKIPYRYKA